MNESNPASHADATRQVLELASQLTAAIELDALLEQIVSVACSVLNADRATVFLYDEEPQELYARVASGESQIRFSAKSGIAGHTIQHREIVNVPDCYADERFNTEIDKQTGYRTNNLLSIPLLRDGEQRVGVLQVLNKAGGPFDQDDEVLAGSLASLCAVALQRAMLVEAQIVKEKLERDLALARDIQMRVLPKVMPDVPGYDVAGKSTPADQTGGDVFDLIKMDDGRVALLLGDATGHGIGPALSVTQVRAMFRLALRLHADLDDIVAHVNDQLTDDLPPGRFVTAFMGILDPAEHRLDYHAAGQAPLLLMRGADRTVKRFDASTLPLGIIEPLPLDERCCLQLGPGDVFALITDGVFEYQDATNAQFGTGRVEDILSDNASLPMAQMLDQLDEEVAQFADGAPQQDDITLLLIKRVAN